MISEIKDCPYWDVPNTSCVSNVRKIGGVRVEYLVCLLGDADGHLLPDENWVSGNTFGRSFVGVSEYQMDE